VVVPYTYDDLVAGLNQVVAYGWAAFFQARLTSLSERAPLGGVQAAGWRLVYSDEQSALSKAYESQMGRLDLRYSIGALMDVQGNVTDVIPGTPAAAAGLVPGMKVLGVNMRRFTSQRLRDAIRERNTASANLQLLVSSQEDFLSLNVHYQGGERYPRLERDESKPDLLGVILSPLSPVQ
jgi:predicted metalloprotease with PDZ domain